MNNWLKIGLPVLVAVLLVVAAVGVTLAATNGGNSNQIAAAYRTVGTGNVQFVSGPYGPGYSGCPAWRWTGYSSARGWCWGGYN